MKKRLYITIAAMAVLLLGCNKENATMNFIPTPKVTPIVENKEDQEAETGEDGETPSDEIAEDEVVVKYVKLKGYNDTLNIRKAPVDGQVVGFFVHGDKVEVINIEEGWASFYKGEEIYYVSNDYLVDEQPEELLPPTPTPSPKPTPTLAPTPEEDTQGEEALEEETEDAETPEEEEELPPEI